METAWNIGKALADWLATYGTIVVMRGNPADEILVTALVEGLRLQGRDVLDGGTGSKESVMQRIESDGLSGGVLIARDEEQDVAVIKLYDGKAQLISAENGLQDISELVGGGNFVPAAQKGELTHVA